MDSTRGVNVFASVQEELSKQFSSAFQGVDKLELQTFLAVMRILKIELADRHPETYRTFLALLKDYDPQNLHQKEKTKKYICLLLEDFPELADYIMSVLPSWQATSHGHSLWLMSNNNEAKSKEDKEDKQMQGTDTPRSLQERSAEASNASPAQSDALGSPHYQGIQLIQQDLAKRQGNAGTSGQPQITDAKESSPNSARFENKEYLKQMRRLPSPPDYTNPWGVPKTKNRKKNVSDVKK